MIEQISVMLKLGNSAVHGAFCLRPADANRLIRTRPAEYQK